LTASTAPTAAARAGTGMRSMKHSIQKQLHIVQSLRQLSQAC